MGTKHISKKTESVIVELSKTKSEYEIASLYNRTQSGIHLILKRNGISKLKKSRLNMSHHALNVDYFKEINSNDKAYWLGFICADGNIKKTNNKVSLISKDLEVINEFKEAIGSEHIISKRINFDKRTNKTYTGYSIQIGNEKFTTNLINLGVTSNKTDILKFPNINEKYYSYFIAGLFDGDGSVFWRGKYSNHLGVNLISTYEIIFFIQNYLQKNMDITPKCVCRVSKNKLNVWKMYLYSDAHKFLKFIYCDDNFKYYLKRKYDIYLENVAKRNSVRHFRKILQYDKTMNLIKVWNSQKEISRDFPCSESNLNKYLKQGIENKTFKNYIWKYDE